MQNTIVRNTSELVDEYESSPPGTTGIAEVTAW
ncbi:hypothetical protein SAMN06269185_3099 [Natronoarchaeum philippinense]|uniref:Uncharacterized protein n=1 Tax=Natronoarchaeum philippinense TaxID=558529 RepID=A0A285P943_NATPI|nr:hypothetical protein SAMN06269185_3099 [Natronoarchaeum philippinense]